jgi:hypothetical protein
VCRSIHSLCLTSDLEEQHNVILTNNLKFIISATELRDYLKTFCILQANLRSGLFLWGSAVYVGSQVGPPAVRISCYY